MYRLSKKKEVSLMMTEVFTVYRIALNFGESKFSRKVIFEDFVSRIRCTCTPQAEQLKIHEFREIKDPRKFSAIW